MKKFVILICTVIFILSGCASKGAGAIKTLDFEAFLGLLEANGFSVATGQAEGSLLSVNPKVVGIGDVRLTVYVYETNEAMEMDSGNVGIDGVTIYFNGTPIEMSWSPPPFWFKRDLLIVCYSGKDGGILDFLKENLELFAGG